MICDDAVAAERQGQLELAAELYERSFAQEPMPMWAMRNLMGLYWQAGEFGFWNTKHLPRSFVDKVHTRLYELLPLAQTRFPDSTAVAFWCRYIRWADLGEPLSAPECEQFLRMNPEDLTPVVFLYSQLDGEKWEPEAMRLLEQCKPEKTLRADYIVSVIESAYNRSHRQK